LCNVKECKSKTLLPVLSVYNADYAPGWIFLIENVVTVLLYLHMKYQCNNIGKACKHEHNKLLQSTPDYSSTDYLVCRLSMCTCM